MYGLGCFLVTLYQEQWEEVLTMEKDVRAFVTKREPGLKMGE
jgi:hypothetical protein